MVYILGACDGHNGLSRLPAGENNGRLNRSQSRATEDGVSTFFGNKQWSRLLSKQSGCGFWDANGTCYTIRKPNNAAGIHKFDSSRRG